MKIPNFEGVLHLSFCPSHFWISVSGFLPAAEAATDPVSSVTVFPPPWPVQINRKTGKAGRYYSAGLD